MEFTDKKKRKRVHNGKEEIDEYINCIAKGVTGYATTHALAYEQGIPVDLKDVPKTIEEVADLSARLVYIDQREIIESLAKDMEYLMTTIESLDEEFDEEDEVTLESIKKRYRSILDNEPEKKRVKCHACGKHIHIDDFGAVVNNVYYCKNLTCLDTIGKDLKL